jgi:hypothetical protein
MNAVAGAAAMHALPSSSRLDAYLTCYGDGGEELGPRGHQGANGTGGGGGLNRPPSPSPPPPQLHLDVDHFLQQKVVEQNCRRSRHR